MPAHDIQVVTFDADGTIWDFQQTMRDELGVSLRALQHMYPEEAAELTVEEMVAHRDEAAKVFRGQPMTMEGLRFAAFVRSLDAIGVRDESLARKMAREYLERRYANATVFDDAVPALEALKDHFRLGLLTNGNSYPEKLGIGSHSLSSLKTTGCGSRIQPSTISSFSLRAFLPSAFCILAIAWQMMFDQPAGLA